MVHIGECWYDGVGRGDSQTAFRSSVTFPLCDATSILACLDLHSNFLLYSYYSTLGMWVAGAALDLVLSVSLFLMSLSFGE